MIDGFKVSISQSDIAAIEALLDPRNTQRALQAAVSRTVTTGVALVARKIGATVKLPIGAIKSQIDAKRGSYDDPTGTITVTRKATWLSQFLTTAKLRTRIKRVSSNLFREVKPKGGITAKVRQRASGKYPATQTFPHAFIAAGAVGASAAHVGVFQRTGVKRRMTKGRYDGKVREVIRRMPGPSALGVFLHAQGEEGGLTVINETVKNLDDVLEKNLASQVDRFLAGKGN